MRKSKTLFYSLGLFLFILISLFIYSFSNREFIHSFLKDGFDNFNKKIVKIYKVCGSGVPPLVAYSGIRCDTRSKYYGYARFLPPCSNISYPYLHGYSYPNLHDYILPKNRIFKTGISTSDYVNNIVCAHKNSDQIATLNLMLWSQAKQVTGQKVCIPSLYEYVHNSATYSYCIKNEDYKSIISPDIEILFKDLEEQVKYSKLKSQITKQGIPEKYKHVSGIASVWNEYGIPELWLFRYVYNNGVGNIDSEDRHIWKELFTSGFDMNLVQILNLKEVDNYSQEAPK